MGMMKDLLFKLACSCAFLVAGSAAAQYGYVPQSIPGAGAGVAPAPGMMDPNMGMGMASNTPYAVQGGQPASYGMGSQMFGSMSAPSSSILTYGQLEVAYSRTTFEDKKIDPTNGIGIGLMAELFKPFFVNASFAWGASSSQGKTKFDFSTISIGGGGYLPISERFHLVAEVGGMYSSLSASKSKLSFSDGAVYINPYLRFAPSPDFEIRAGITATSADDYDSRIVNLGAYYKLFSQMDIGLNAGLGDATRTYDLGVRFRW
jgi:hypothetical protein